MSSGAVRFIGPTHVVVPVGRDGVFSIRLQPGRYDVTGRSSRFASRAWQCEDTEPIDVVPGATKLVDVYCQMR